MNVVAVVVNPRIGLHCRRRYCEEKYSEIGRVVRAGQLLKSYYLLLKQKSKYYKTHSQSDSEKGQEIVRFSSADPRCRMKLHMVGI